MIQAHNSRHHGPVQHHAVMSGISSYAVWAKIPIFGNCKKANGAPLQHEAEWGIASCCPSLSHGDKQHGRSS